MNYAFCAGPEQLQDMINIMLRPSGLLTFVCQNYRFEQWREKTTIILNIKTGYHIFKIVKDENDFISFIHSSPGTGTRIVTLNFARFLKNTQLAWQIVWNPKDIMFRIDNDDTFENPEIRYGQKAEFQLRLAENGEEISLGSEESIHYYSYNEGGKSLLKPTAIQSWDGTKYAIKKILDFAENNDDYLHEIINGNIAISMLVTGMEVYCHRRFAEIEREGFRCDYEKLLNSFLTLEEISYGKKKNIILEAQKQRVPVSTIIVRKKIVNFQNYEECKKAYNKGYKISFGKDLGISNKTLEVLQDLISHRHKVIHVSPFESEILTPKSKFKDRIHSNKKSYKLIVETFDIFIQALHSATMKQ